MKINLENTNWNYPTPIRFGVDRVKELSLFIDELKISNPLIVTDPQFREVNQFKGIIDSLNNSNKNYSIFSEIKGNPTGTNIRDGVDVFLKNNTLYVTHSESEINKKRTIESLYLTSLEKLISSQLYSINKLQILIDIKSDPKNTLNKIVQILNQYPQIINQKNISIVISGNRPDPEEYEYYPDFIFFDHQSLDPLVKQKMWSKIALISLDFGKFSNWNGKGSMTAKDYKKVDSVVRIAHQYGKPFRFWATPDTKGAWKTFRILGVNYINTDHPAQASNYFKKEIH